MTRGKGQFLTPAEKEKLHAALRRGESVHVLAERFDLSVRNVMLHRAKVQGRGDARGRGEGEFSRHPAIAPFKGAVSASPVIANAFPDIPRSKLMGRRA